MGNVKNWFRKNVDIVFHIGSPSQYMLVIEDPNIALSLEVALFGYPSFKVLEVAPGI